MMQVTCHYLIDATVVSWLSGNHMVYLWGGMDPFLPVPFAHEADARSIARMSSFLVTRWPPVLAGYLSSIERTNLLLLKVCEAGRTMYFPRFNAI